MGEPLWVLLLKVFGGPLVSGLVAAGITYWFSRRRFIGERWWDRKADAYGSIIGSLVGMIHSLDFLISEIEHWLPSFPESRAQERELPSEYVEARDRVGRFVIGGDYVISEKASQTLSDLMEELPVLRFGGVLKHDDWVDWLLKTRETVKYSLKIVRAEAQSDLGVRR